MEKNSVYFISSKLKIMGETRINCRINCHSKCAIIKNDQYEQYHTKYHDTYKLKKNVKIKHNVKQIYQKILFYKKR